MIDRRTAMRAGQPWYSLGLGLLVVGLMINLVMRRWTIGNFPTGDFVGGLALGMALVFLVYALVKIRRAKRTGGAA
ncbi:MAG: hypothetical protein M3N05_01320 [Pseudomonadota bacterium]|nr:hypothetical protein [Pseudomonadota bacterium]